MENEQVKTTPKAPKAVKVAKTAPAKKESIEAQIFDIKGKETGTVALNKEIFGKKNNPALIAQYVRVYLQNQRQGTVATKTRSEVVGSTRKIYRQKGTGGARHASRKAPIFVGGGVTFGPQPRTFSLSMNKKQKKQALFIALSAKADENAVKVLDENVADMKPKTKTVSEFLKAVKLTGRKVMFVLPQVTKNSLVLSARNIPNIEIVQANTINPYAVLNTRQLIFVGDALTKLEEHFTQTNETE